MSKILPVVSDKDGNLFELPEYQPCGRSGYQYQYIPEDYWIELPYGSDLFLLQDCAPVVFNSHGQLEILSNYNGNPIHAVSAFPAPAHTVLLLAAYKKSRKAPYLPLYAYSAVGWKDGKFFIPALRVDPDIRQDPANFNSYTLKKRAREMRGRFRQNRLALHLIENCALQYGCPAARNFVLNRWEMPLPTATGCNARCAGCISKQPANTVPPAQPRLQFIPTPEEIAEITLFHFETAPRPIASFGQGCEGEPLTNANLLLQATCLIRSHTSAGSLNLNTNGSKPEVIRELCKAGMDSFRISVNSFQEKYYNNYFQPVDYTFKDVVGSMEIVKAEGKFLSINYFVLPGVTDSVSEKEAFFRILQRIPIDMIQWRNLNMDPDWYLTAIDFQSEEAMGMKRLMDEIKGEFPGVRFGYFNPYLAHDN